MIVCKKCGEQKEDELFGKRKGIIIPICKKCEAKRTRDLYHKNIDDRRKKQCARNKNPENREKNRIRQRKWALENRDKRRLIEQKWQSSNRDKVNFWHSERRKRDWKKSSARSLIQSRIKRGVLTRPEKCEKCEIICKPQAHHEDYDLPHIVQWVCKDCHNKIHGKLKGI